MVGDELRPRWTYNLPQGTVVGIHSSGGMPPLVYILVTIDGRISVLSNRDGVVWEYQTGASHVTAGLSSDGRKVVAVDSQGDVYLFNINNAEPIWKTSTELTDISLSLFQDSAIAIGGKSADGGGQVYVLSLKGPEPTWGWHCLKPISSVSISCGDQVIAKQQDGDAYILWHVNGEVKEHVIDIPGRVQTVISPQFGSYVAATNHEGQLYFLYTPRDTPMWLYDSGYASPTVAISSTGEKVFVVTDHEVAVIYNTFQTGFLLGSRRLWGVVFFAGLFGAIGLYSVVLGRNYWLANDIYQHKVLFYGFLFGTLLGYFLEGGFVSIIGGVGCAAGVLYSRRSEGLLGLMVAFFASLISSFIAGYITGLIQWFSGYEANIIVLTVVNASRGGRLGVIVAIIGVLLGKVTSRNIFGKKIYLQ
jgi:hypothetical protein